MSQIAQRTQTHILKCPLIWWKTNESTFPLLSKVTKIYLGTVATFVPAERDFSSQKRNRLKAENVNIRDAPNIR